MEFSKEIQHRSFPIGEREEDRGQWYALYTRPFWEKRIEKSLIESGMEAWCPVRKMYRQWSDRMKLIEEPLFRSYVLVKIQDKDRSKVLSEDGVVDFVRCQGQPAKVREEEIEAVNEFLKEHNNVEAEGLEPGTRVRLNIAVFGDKEGIVKKVEGDKVILELAQLGWKLTAKLDEVRVAK